MNSKIAPSMPDVEDAVPGNGVASQGKVEKIG